MLAGILVAAKWCTRRKSLLLGEVDGLGTRLTLIVSLNPSPTHISVGMSYPNISNISHLRHYLMERILTTIL